MSGLLRGALEADGCSSAGLGLAAQDIPSDVWAEFLTPNTRLSLDTGTVLGRHLPASLPHAR